MCGSRDLATAPHDRVPLKSYGRSLDARRAMEADIAALQTLIMTPNPGSRKETTYFSFKHEFTLEPHISQAKNQHLRRTIAMFRTGTHWLKVQTLDLMLVEFLIAHLKFATIKSRMSLMQSFFAPYTPA